MKQSGIILLHVKEPSKDWQTFSFSTPKQRAQFLRDELQAARDKRLQYTYRPGEYLRVYKGPITFKECDIKKPKVVLSCPSLFN